MHLRIPFTVIAAILSVACADQAGHPDPDGGGGTAGSGGSGGGVGKVCAAQHAAGDVVVCEVLYPDAPFIRPPADTATTAFVATDGLRLYARGADPRLLDSDELAALGLDAVSSDGKIYGYAIYGVARDANGTIVEGAPVIVIEDAALLGSLEGKVAEGLVSRHVPEGDFEYEQTPTLPVRVRFAGITPVGSTDPAFEDAAPSRIALVLENHEAAVTSASGACLPAVTDAGSESPFAATADPALRAFRVPAMHGPGDNELVIEGTALNHMGPWMVMPHHVLLDEDITLADASFTPHGNPLSMPRLELAIADGGGGACTP